MDAETLFNKFYDLLSQTVETTGDAVWFNIGTTVHEALIDLAYEYSEEMGDKILKRLEDDMMPEKPEEWMK